MKCCRNCFWVLAYEEGDGTCDHRLVPITALMPNDLDQFSCRGFRAEEDWVDVPESEWPESDWPDGLLNGDMGQRKICLNCRWAETFSDGHGLCHHDFAPVTELSAADMEQFSCRHFRWRVIWLNEADDPNTKLDEENSHTARLNRDDAKALPLKNKRYGRSVLFK